MPQKTHLNGANQPCSYPRILLTNPKMTPMDTETGNSGQRASSSGQRHAKKSSHAGAGARLPPRIGVVVESWPAPPQALTFDIPAMIRAAGRKGTRFIPACTGNSGRVHSSPPQRPVHPRVYGELSNQGRARFSRIGSSPRVRGTPPNSACRRSSSRFIPACAGNSRLPTASVFRRSVHPRVYGELVYDLSEAMVRTGSSPRVRGTPQTQVTGGAYDRFIPACAGNSP